MSNITRRRLLGLMATGAGMCSLSVPAHAGARLCPVPNSPIRTGRHATYFPQSVASGSPRPESVVLWTRVIDPKLPDDDLEVVVQWSSSRFFRRGRTWSAKAMARATNDHCVKLKIGHLRPGTRYYYRFLYLSPCGRRLIASRTGRTKTAPHPNADVTARFAFFSCQDYLGRWYNSYAHLRYTYAWRKNDLDFTVHLGDYIYETTGDPSFQTSGAERGFRFDDEAGAIALGDPSNPFFAARSLSNYRQLYKIYRSDRQLQRIHELYPMVAIWDDHEFSDDSWADNGTFFDGLRDERDTGRKRNAERAWFEYMPVEQGLDPWGELAVGDDDLFPKTRIYDAFTWGRNLELVLTDYRTFRPDHLIPEDAFPGTVVMDEAVLTQFLGAGIEPYVDIDAPALALRKQVLVQAVFGGYVQAYLNDGRTPAEAQALAQARTAQVVQGLLAVQVVNAFLQAALDAGAIDQPTFDALAVGDAELVTLPRGLAYATMGKTTLFSSFGSRYAVAQDLYAVYAAYVKTLDSERDNFFGPAQRAWVRDTLETSPATWKVLAKPVSSTPLVLDFSGDNLAVEGILAQGGIELPPDFRARIQLNADQADGFPVENRDLLNFLSQIPNTVLIAGDLHSSFVTDHGDRSFGGGPFRVFEFTGTSISSGTFQDFVAAASTTLGIPGGEQLAPLLPVLLTESSTTAPASLPSVMEYAVTDQHGYVVVEAGAKALRAVFHHYPTQFVSQNLYRRPGLLRKLFMDDIFEVRDDTLTKL